MRSTTFLLLLSTCISQLASAWILPNSVKNGASTRNSSTRLMMGISSNNKEKDNAMLEFMNRMAEKPAISLPEEPLDADVLELVEIIAHAADGRKADDIVALNVGKCTSLCSALVILSGNSRPQNQAIVKAIRDSVEERFDISKLPEGTADSGWMLLDYGSVMVHIMTPKSRLYYNVEGQWRDKGGDEIDLSRVLVPNTPGESNAQQLDIPQEQDPFWS